MRKTITTAFIAFATLTALEGAAQAEAEDAVEGRLTLSAAYGFLAAFYQDDDASGLNPAWGHGVHLRLAGERCRSFCYGLTALGAVNVRPSATGNVGVGPHFGMRWDGPSWAGAYMFRTGASYFWLMTPEPSFANGEIELGEGRGAHGVGAWLELAIELSRTPRFVTPIIGLRGRYVAVVSTDPIEHHLSAQLTIGFTLGRRLIFNQSEELELEESQELLDDEEDTLELDEVDEQRLREAEEEIRE